MRNGLLHTLNGKHVMYRVHHLFYKLHHLTYETNPLK